MFPLSYYVKKYQGGGARGQMEPNKTDNSADYWFWPNIVKLQSKLNCPVQVGPGVDFVFPLSQQEEEQEEQPSPKSPTRKYTTDLKFGT